MIRACPGSPLVLLALVCCNRRKVSRRYPSRPWAGVGAVVLDDDRVLLVQRGREPQKGLWSIPGGALKLGETLEEGVRREVREEAGIEVSVAARVDVVDRIVRDSEGRVEYHYALVGFLCRVDGRELHPADDASGARWVERSAVADFPMTPGTPAVVEKAFELRDRLAAAGDG